MVDVYYYVPAKMADHIIDCGLKLSEWFDREVLLEGETRKCISTLLNPRDDREKYKSARFRCLKIEVDPRNCYVADRFLHETGQFSDKAAELYQKTVILAENYKFGMYRLPECLLSGTILTEQIRPVEKRLNNPVLFESSEKLYTSNIMENYREENDRFNDVLLYYFYNKLAEFKKIDKIEDKEKGMAVFFDKEQEKTFCIRIPEEV